MAKQTGGKSPARKILSSRALRISAATAAVLFLALSVASLFLDEPLRAAMEKRMNRDLHGYAVRLPGLHVGLLGLSLTLKGLTVIQQAHPDPPVVQIPLLKASIQWRGILSGRLVARLLLERPKININLQQLSSETANKASLKERGWQRAAEEIYPLKMNSMQVDDASITYIDRDPARPLVLSHLNLKAANIRNIHLPDQVYPSTFHLDTAIFGSGRGSVDGAANFLSEPYPGMKGRVQLEKVPVDYFRPLFARNHLTIHGGLLQASGEAEYAPKLKSAHLEKLSISGMKLDYLHAPDSAGADRKRVVLLGKKARKLDAEPGLELRADQVSLTGCSLGLVNETPGKSYRLFLADTNLELNNFSNRFARGPARARLTGKFMGSGATTASAEFRPDREATDFDLHFRIEDSQLTAMNDLLRAYGNFDVAAGSFAMVSELHVKNGMLTGYIKPFFKDVKVYDKAKDKGRGTLHKIYERLVGGVAEVLENRSRHEVATKVNIRGSVVKPKTSSWQIVGQLLKNAFFKAIIPSFDTIVPGSSKR